MIVAVEIGPTLYRYEVGEHSGYSNPLGKGGHTFEIPKGRISIGGTSKEMRELAAALVRDADAADKGLRTADGKARP